MSKVMIVDDHSDIVDTIKIIVEKLGHQTDTANNGEELLKKVTESTPDLILLDVMMPGLTTKQILEKLVEKGLGKAKIILITVVRFDEEQIKRLMKENNIVDYIRKPFHVADLIERIKKNL